MKALVPSVVALSAACVVALGQGCSPAGGRSWGSSSGSSARQEGGQTVRLTEERLTCDNRVYLVLLASGCNGSGGGGGSGTYRGQLHAAGGREVAWSCSTGDAKTGQVVIDGQAFDLAAGSLFLVSAKQAPARAEQVDVPAGQLQVLAASDDLTEMAKADARVAAFLESCKDKE